MPTNNKFQHQQYPTQPQLPPSFHQLEIDSGSMTGFDRLHAEFGIGHVVLVHGTFMGNDPFGVAETLLSVADSIPVLRRPLEALATKLANETKPVTDTVTGDIANYDLAFRDRFQQLVGDDPQIELLQPTWSGQNHHLARADLAVRLLRHLEVLQPDESNRVLLWGHSHAGNGFAVLSNLLANDRESVDRFFEASAFKTKPHWVNVRNILSETEGPVPWAKWVSLVAFGTPVRYGWDPDGYRNLIHVLHHRNFDPQTPDRAQPMFPPHSIGEALSAKYGDWVQAFAIAGTDVAPPTLIAANSELGGLLESGLAVPVHGSDTRFIPAVRIRNACARWKTGTRCHTDGFNLLVDYKPSGRIIGGLMPVEEVLLGHGVATTIDWLPCHLGLVMQYLGKNPGR